MADKPHAGGDPLDDFVEGPQVRRINPASFMESGLASKGDQRSFGDRRTVEGTVHEDESQHFYAPEMNPAEAIRSEVEAERSKIG